MSTWKHPDYNYSESEKTSYQAFQIVLELVAVSWSMPQVKSILKY